MITLTATEVSRSFAAVLDAAQGGERIIVTRGGQRVAEIGPTSAGNGARVAEHVRAWRGRVDSGFARDVRVTRDAVVLDDSPWPGD